MLYHKTNYPCCGNTGAGHIHALKSFQTFAMLQSFQERNEFMWQSQLSRVKLACVEKLYLVYGDRGKSRDVICKGNLTATLPFMIVLIHTIVYVE